MCAEIPLFYNNSKINYFLKLKMSLLKSWMTDILLEVTNSEMQLVAKEVIQYEKDLKLKQQLKKTKASLNISYGLGFRVRERRGV